MIQVNQLRIDSYVLDNDNLLCKVTGFKPFDHSTRCDEEEGCLVLLDIFNHNTWNKNWECESVNLKPIELTEDILLKCGFTFNGYNYDLGRFNFHAQGVNNGVFYNTELSIKKDVTKLCISYNIKYLHQLQNLYFAQTNTELEIKL